MDTKQAYWQKKLSDNLTSLSRCIQIKNDETKIPGLRNDAGRRFEELKLEHERIMAILSKLE